MTDPNGSSNSNRFRFNRNRPYNNYGSSRGHQRGNNSYWRHRFNNNQHTERFHYQPPWINPGLNQSVPPEQIQEMPSWSNQEIYATENIAPFNRSFEQQRYLPGPVNSVPVYPLHRMNRPEDEMIMQNMYGGILDKRLRMEILEDDEEYHPEPINNNNLRRNYIGLGSNESIQEDTSSSSNLSYTDTEEDSVISESKTDPEEECSPDSPKAVEDEILKTKQLLLKSPLNPTLPEGCKQDDELFLEIYIAAEQQRLTAAFGIWLSETSDLNFGSLMPQTRPQSLKAVLIYGSGKGICMLKEKGFNRIKIIMESDFLVKNVETWTHKFMADACKDLELSNFSNWDEYKHSTEIKQLCQSFQGMIVKWSYVTTKLHGIEKAKNLAREMFKK